jgi:hypothetical protein
MEKQIEPDGYVDKLEPRHKPIKEVRTREREWMTPAPADSAVGELPDQAPLPVGRWHASERIFSHNRSIVS